MSAQERSIQNGCAQRFKAAEASRTRLWCIILVLLTIVGASGSIIFFTSHDVRERLARVEERLIAVQKTLEAKACP